MTIRYKREALRRLLGAIACACFVLQASIVPLHLALSDHGTRSGLTQHAHVHESQEAGHGHGHRHGPGHGPGHEDALLDRAKDADEGHPLHPVEDHQNLLGEPAVVPQLVLVALAPAPAAVELFASELPSHRLHFQEELGPGPPPPRAEAAPRAPPIVV